ncbi:MAG TPA: hypothetical protein VGS11_11025 [Candidatus Bathyarchaeia archaeon]|nr:hypothetical protein [Candidatus Bathyarchaeia archaeon]
MSSFETSRTEAKASEMAGAWQSEGWGSIRADELWKKSKDRFFTSKTDFYYALKWLGKHGTIQRNAKSHKKVYYMLTKDYEDVQAATEAATAEMTAWRKTLGKIPPNAQDADVYRYMVPYLFALLYEEWKGIGLIPRAKPQFVPLVHNLFKISTTEFINQLQDTGRRYPQQTNSSVRLIDGVLIAVMLDLFKILFDREMKIDKVAQEHVKIAIEDLIKFKGERSPKLSLLKL